MKGTAHGTPPVPMPCKPLSPAPELPRGVYSPMKMEEVAMTFDEESKKKRLLTDPLRELATRLWLGSAPGGEFFCKETPRRSARSLSDQVLGIMSRLTPENYALQKEMLRGLPLRQMTDEEVEELARLMFNKAVRPMPEIYADLYAELMADLVAFTGREVGEMFRRSLVDRCQRCYEQPFQPTQDGVLPDNESMWKERQQAIIDFVGNLYLSGFIVEKVITRVLFALIYPSCQDQKRRPQPHELEMFCALLKKAVPKLSHKAYDGYVIPFMSTMQKLQRSKYLPPRIKFMLMDLTDLFNKDWQVRHSLAARKTVPPTPDFSAVQGACPAAAHTAGPAAVPNPFALPGDGESVGGPRLPSPLDVPYDPPTVAPAIASTNNAAEFFKKPNEPSARETAVEQAAAAFFPQL